jgi:hypothetical protein
MLAFCLLQVARIRTTRRAECTVVIVTGRLTAADMGRLEHACSPALTSRALRLEIDLRRVTDSDDTATAVVQRMVDRGAVVIAPAADHAPIARVPAPERVI